MAGKGHKRAPIGGNHFTGNGGHFPSILSQTLGIKSNGPFPRMVGGEFIATSVEEAMTAKMCGVPVASEEKSASVRWNGGKPILPSHPAYAPMMANKVANQITGTSISNYGYGCQLPYSGYGYGYQPTYTSAYPLRPAFAPAPAIYGTPGAVPISSMPASTDAVPVPALPSAPAAQPQKKAEKYDDEQFDRDTEIAKELSKISSKDRQNHQEGLTHQASTSSLSSGHTKFCQECGNQLPRITSKFCDNCGHAVIG